MFFNRLIFHRELLWRISRGLSGLCGVSKRSVTMFTGIMLSFIVTTIPSGCLLEAANNNHKIEIDAINGASRHANYPLQITDIFTYDAVTADTSEQTETFISYSLSKPEYIRIRIIRRNNKELVLHTLLDWSPRGIGKNREKWDFRDSLGSIIDNKKVRFVIEHSSKSHGQHIWDKCHELKIISVDFNFIKDRNAKMNPPRVKVALDERYSGYSNKYGYRIRSYLDYKIIQETNLPIGSTPPFVIELNEITMDEKEHVLTINIDDYHDHIGSSSIHVNAQ